MKNIIAVFIAFIVCFSSPNNASAIPAGVLEAINPNPPSLLIIALIVIVVFLFTRKK